jgi:hypothetical protein
MMILVQSLGAQNKGGRWQFENNGFDTADWDAQSDDGNLQGDAIYSAVNTSEGTHSLFLDTLFVHDFFRIEDSDDLDFTNEDIAISAWIYPIVLNDVHYLINKGDNIAQSRTTNYSLRIANNKELEFLVRDSSNQAQRVTSSFSIPVNQWTFVAAFFDYESDIVYMWNDPFSDPVDTLTFDVDFFANDDPLAIGTWYTSAAGSSTVKDFQGGIDDVRISNRINDVLVTSISENRNPVPDIFALNQNYPNPFNSSTLISFELTYALPVELDVFDLRGRKVKTLIQKTLQRGKHEIRFVAEDLSTGVYIYRVSTPKLSQQKKMILFK